jgi:23S rRNA (adenine-N6)-dimethyltransferase
MPKVPSRRRAAAPVCGAPPGVRLAHSQNFITDRALIRRLLCHIELGKADTVIEIGPGKGALTTALARMAGRVLAVEADPEMVLALLRRFKANPRVSIPHGDFLDFPLPARPFIVVANIPFNRTAEIVRKLTSEQSGLTAAYLIMQREAARKFSGQPPGPYSLLSHFIQLEFTMNTLRSISRRCFSPQPRVDAAFALFRKRKIPVLTGGQASQFKDLLSYLLPRGPLLKDALRHVFTRAQVWTLMSHLGLERGRHLRDVAFADWLAVSRAVAEHARPAAHRKLAGACAQLAREQAGLSKRHRTSRS